MTNRTPPRYTVSTKLFVRLTLMLLVVFTLIAWINTYLYTGLVEKNMRDHAFQTSDLIKSSLLHSMLKNQRENLSNIIANIGKEKGLEGVWIYDKHGQVRFASDSSSVNSTVEKDAEQCCFCHSSGKPQGAIPKLNRIRYLKSSSGDRIMGLINPIDNSPSCSSAVCHAHNANEKLLGLLDIKLSLRELDQSMQKTRLTVFLISGALIVITALLFRGFIQRIVHRPISKLVRGTEQVAAMNLDYQIAETSHDDLGHLSESFNLMTQKLKKAIQELEKTQDHIVLVEKMASLGKLAAVVAHEINNPMAGIITYSKLSTKNLSGSPTDADIAATLENLKMISSETKRCSDMVKNLLLFSKRRYEEMSHHDIVPIINRSLELARASIKTATISFKLEILAKNTSLICDPTDMQQMLLIFLINAMEAVSTRDDGEIHIRLLGVDEGKKLQLEIIDNGVGIPQEAMSRIFEPFFTTKQTAESTGLGLSVAYRIIVTRHGGTISVNSKINQGTTFTIDLPVSGPEHKASENHASRQNPNLA